MGSVGNDCTEQISKLHLGDFLGIYGRADVSDRDDEAQGKLTVPCH